MLQKVCSTKGKKEKENNLSIINPFCILTVLKMLHKIIFFYHWLKLNHYVTDSSGK